MTIKAWQKDTARRYGERIKGQPLDREVIRDSLDSFTGAELDTRELDILTDMAIAAARTP